MFHEIITRGGVNHTVSRTVLVLAALMLIPFLSFAHDDLCGLRFLSHQVSKEERTSAYMEDDRGIRIRDYFNLTFDYKLYSNPAGRFGNICKITLDDRYSIDLLYNIKYNNENSVTLLIGGQIIKEWKVVPGEESEKHWNRVSVSIFRKDARITVVNNSDSLTVAGKDAMAGRKTTARFVFGAGDGHSSRDVASFILGNVSVSLRPDREKYHWDMERHGLNYVYDRYAGKKLLVENPNWLIDDHIAWKKEDSFLLPEFHFVQDDGDSLYIITADSLCIYSLPEKTFRSLHYEHPVDISEASNHFLWNNGRLEYLNVSDSSYLCAVFDTVAREWQPSFFTDRRKTMQANVFLSGGKRVQMFGYGFHRYSDKIYVEDNGAVRRFNVPVEIPPRYMSAVGACDSILYVYSGVGNDSGMQMTGAGIYNDFYSLDMTTGNVESLRSFPELGLEAAAMNLLFIDSRSAFYALFFNPFKNRSYLQLKKADFSDGSVTCYADTIPYIFHDVTSEARLLYSEKENKLYAVSKNITAGDAYELNIWSIHYPVYHLEDVILEEKCGISRTGVMTIAFALLGLCILCVIIYVRNRKTAVPDVRISASPVSVPAGHDYVPDTTEVRASRKPGIYFLGGFCVIDKSGTDITGKFTPVMTQLLCILILNTIKNGKGISGPALKEILWSDKSDESAINNRSVNIRKLRLILESVGGFRIVHESSWWRFVVPDNVECDIFSAGVFLDKYNGKSFIPDREASEKLVSLCSRGNLLPDLHYEWLDDFKFSYSTDVIDALNKTLLMEQDNSSRVVLSSAIMKFSPLDEEALAVKCSSLVALGKNGLAKAAFASFCKEYEATMGENLPYSFEKVCALDGQ